MDTFQLGDLFGPFLVFLALFMIIVLLDLFYEQCISCDVRNPIYRKHHSFRFHMKRMVARLLLKLGKRKAMPDYVVDQLQTFSDADEMPVDAVYYNTSAANHQLLVFSAARRKNGLINSLGFIKVPEFSSNLLTLPSFPETTLYQTAEEQKVMNCYTVAGLKITSMVPKKEYRIEYIGKMLLLDSEPYKEIDVELNAVWRSNLPAFNFSTDISTIAMSEAMALQPWSREWFEILKTHHQTHFEQYGDVEGIVKINGSQYPIKTSGMRDRTIGAKRDWNDFHRYAIHMIRLDNGNAITIGVVSMPVMFTRLVIGFVTKAKDNINVPIDSCSIDLNEYDKHDPPETYNFGFVANNDSYRVHVKRHTKTNIYIGEQSESCLVETWCDFKVNGVKGWGATEWQYQNEKKQPNY